MKPIDGDKILSDLYDRIVRSADVGDVVVKYKDIINVIRDSPELPIQYETAEPTTRYRDYNGYVWCSNCNSRVTNISDKYCGKCGKKFVE